MFAHARKGEVNYSNNPTFLKYNQALTESVTDRVYEENSSREIGIYYICRLFKS